MKKIISMCIAALITTSTLLAPAAMAAEEQKLPSGLKYENIANKFDKELNFETGDGIEYYAGFEAIVFHDDDILYEGYFGETDRENHIACDEDSVFEWGSISKTMIWVSAMQLWEQGRLDLGADIKDYLPDGFLKHLTYDEPITMMNIMDHTAGWCETTYSISTPDHDKIMPLAEALQATEPTQINRPGEVTSYSNWGAALGAYVIECVSGMDYVDYIHENIFNKLGMEHTSIAPDFSDNEWVRSQRDKLKSYTFTAIPPKYKSDGSMISYINLYPAGSATGTIRDLATYAQAFVSDDAPLFEHKETQEKMFSGSLFYGNSDIPASSYGFGVTEYRVRTMGHNGATIACQSNMLFDLESKTGLVTLTNETSVNLVIQEVPEWIFGKADYEKYSDGNGGTRSFNGYYLVSRSQRAGLMKFTSFLQPINAKMYPAPERINDGVYLLGGSMLLGESKRSDGNEGFMLGAMEIDKDNAYPLEISLLAAYFMIAIGAVFILLYKFKLVRAGRNKVTAVGAMLTASQIIKLLSIVAAVVMIAYSGREETYGLPKVVGTGAGIVNIICIAVCAAAAVASIAGIVSKSSGKWMKAGYGVTIAANALVILAVVYFEMYKFWAC